MYFLPLIFLVIPTPGKCGRIDHKIANCTNTTKKSQLLQPGSPNAQCEVPVGKRGARQCLGKLLNSRTGLGGIWPRQKEMVLPTRDSEHR
jgi:hypothetical protein